MIGVRHEQLVSEDNNTYTIEKLPIRNSLMKLKRWNYKKISIILVIICLTCLLVWLYVTHTIPEFNAHRLVKNYDLTHTDNKADKIRFILLWNTFFGDKRWSLPSDVNDPSYFRRDINCPIPDCVLTNDRNILPKINMYDAIVFHAAQPFPIINSIPKVRNWIQLYVFALMEAPGATKHILSDENNFYNLTMTYRTDSDFWWPYGSFVDKETGMQILPSRNVKWRSAPNSYNDSIIWELWPYKTKMAAWFVSNCKTLSRREELVKEIQKYMEVDVFGKCGSKSCRKNSTECNKILDENYKFYFSFENSLCKDYITEKVYNILSRNIIPVVYGGANYKNFLPPHSYINVEDYDSPQDLVNYLKYLSENSEQYMRYFWWRKYYDLGTYSPFCDLCQRLHQTNYVLKSQTYQNIEKWWLQGSCRFQSRIKF